MRYEGVEFKDIKQFQLALKISKKINPNLHKEEFMTTLKTIVEIGKVKQN